MKEYQIRYELDGGVSNNPVSYTEHDEIRLKAPLREGYRFGGWQGSPSLIKKGSRGDRVLSAKWIKADVIDGTAPRKSLNHGCDDGLTHADSRLPVSAPACKGSRGENIYTVKTVYTDIRIDGEKDPAYDYGIHLRSDVSTHPEYYADKDTGFDAYIVRGQDGRAYFFIEVTDPDVIAPDEMWKKNPHRCDGIHLYTDYQTLVIGADPTLKKVRGLGLAVADNCRVVLTEKGYNVEFCLKNSAGTFNDGDLMSFAFFMCDCVSYESLEAHKKHNLRISSALTGNEKYVAPDSTKNDVFAFSEASATGKKLINERDGLVRTDDIISDVISGSRRTAIVYGKDSSAHTVTVLRRLADYLNSFCMPISLITEESPRRCEFDTEILIGVTEDGKNSELVEMTPYNGYGFKIADNSMHLVGWREEAFDKAAGLMLSAFEYVRAGGKSADIDSLFIGETGSVPCKNIPRIDGFVTVTDAGDGAYCIVVKPASAEVYEDYMSRLTESGFELYATNKMNTLMCHTYFDDTAVVTVTYDTNAENGNDLRIVVEPRVMTALPSTDVDEYTPKCQSSITQICPNRMTYIVKLDNGEFIIADSGQNKQVKYIYEELMRLSDDGKPVIALWTFSHFHQDHNGGFIEFVQNEEYMKNVKVKAVLYNTPEYQLISIASALDKRNMAKWESLLDRHGIQRYQARTGQRYRFANAEIKVIYTYEDLMPFFVYRDRTNPTSIVYVLTVEGQRLVITGDCCGEASRLMVARYGDTLKSDFVQLPHHGRGDGGTSPLFYEKVNADYIIWPGEPERLSSAEREALTKVKEYFVMCEGTVTLALPYRGKEDIIYHE